MAIFILFLQVYNQKHNIDSANDATQKDDVLRIEARCSIIDDDSTQEGGSVHKEGIHFVDVFNSTMGD